MENWQERMNQREIEIARQQLITTSHDVDKVKREREKLAYAFETIDRLEVEKLLQEIRRDVWGNKGEIKRFDDIVYDGSAHWIQRKGISLIYAYEEPDDGKREVETVGYRSHSRLFKDYYNEGPRSQQIIGMGDITHERRFEPHIEQIPIIRDYGMVYHMEHKTAYLSVYVAYDEDALNKFGLFISDDLLGSRSLVAETRGYQRNAWFPGDVFRTLFMSSDSKCLEDSDSKSLKDALADACIGRIRLQGIPDNIDLRIQKKLAQIPPSQLKH